MSSNLNPRPNFKSFLWAGYECTYALSAQHGRLDLLKTTKHDVYCREDYQLIKKLGIKTVREGLAWHEIDKGRGVYDFSRFKKIMQIGKEENIQQIWDLIHFDYPQRLDPFSDNFIAAFKEYAQRAVKTIREYDSSTLYIVPINEISYFSWIAGDMGLWAPFEKGRGYELKKQLVRACIKAMEEIGKIDSNVRFIQVDPLLYRRPRNPFDKTAQKIARDFERIKYQTWDMLNGKLEPELGGNPKYLDIIGVNYYYANQEWIKKDQKKDEYYNWGIAWNSKFRISFAKMLGDVNKRYKRPIVISETGSHGDLRAKWWKRTLKEIKVGVDNKIPIDAICAYPVIDYPDWLGSHNTNSGFWDLDPEDELLKRVPHVPTLNIIESYLSKL